MRRLPVLQNTSDPAEERPPWHWTLIGAAFIVTLWLPFAMIASLVVGHVLHGFDGGSQDDVIRLLDIASPSRRLGAYLLISGVHAAALASASCLGGVLVGRFGGRAGPREAARGGLLAGALGWTLTASSTSLLVASALLGLLALASGGSAWLGGKIGHRARTARGREVR